MIWIRPSSFSRINSIITLIYDCNVLFHINNGPSTDASGSASMSSDQAQSRYLDFMKRLDEKYAAQKIDIEKMEKGINIDQIPRYLSSTSFP